MIDEASKTVLFVDGEPLSIQRFDDRWISATGRGVSYELDRESKNLAFAGTIMKAGTATKMILNMITTGAMIRLGKVYQNLMVDLRALSQKMRDRAVRIFRTLTDEEDGDAAWKCIEEANGRVKTAIVMKKMGLPVEEAEKLLESCDGFLRRALSGEKGDVS